jgi:hypothetical protein
MHYVILAGLLLLLWATLSGSRQLSAAREGYDFILRMNPDHPLRQQRQVATVMLWLVRTVAVAIAVGVYAMLRHG